MSSLAYVPNRIATPQKHQSTVDSWLSGAWLPQVKQYWWRGADFSIPRPCADKGLTEVVEAVWVGARLVVFQHELEVVRGLVDDHARVLAAVVDDFAQAVPRVLLHKELGGHVLHLHHLRAVWELVSPAHPDRSKAEIHKDAVH